MAARDFLEEKPPLDELYENVQLGTKWYQFGVLLKLDTKQLDAIHQLNENADFKALQMFNFWLDTNTNATRRQVLETLRKDSISENAVADNYEKRLSNDIPCTRTEDTESGPSTGKSLCDESATSGKAIPLCLPNDYVWDEKTNTCTKKSVKRDSLVINEKAVKILEEITNPISVVAVVGPCCSGKSYLLNQLIRSKESLFELGHTMIPNTVGIWMWDTPLQNKRGETIILLDTEGVDAVRAGTRGDTQVFTLSVLLSSLLVYNSTQVPKRENLNQMTFIVNLAKAIASKGAKAKNSFKRIAPSFFWLLRDALLQPVNSQGHPCNFKEYLSEMVLVVPEHFSEDEIQIQATECLLEVFTSLDAEMIPPPSVDGRVTVNIDSPRHREKINPEFFQKVDHVCAKILNECQPKRGYTEGCMNGLQFTEMLKIYVDALNSEDGIPRIGTAWDQAMKNLYESATSRAKDKYKKKMSDLQFPTDEDKIQKRHEEAYEQSMELFKKLTELDVDRDTYQKNREELDAIFATYVNGSCNGGLLYQYCEENKRVSRKHCQEMLQNLRLKHFNPLIESLSRETSYQDIDTTIEEIMQIYFEQSKGPAQEDAFKRFMENLEKEKKPLMLILDRMKSYDEELEQCKKDKMELENQLQSDKLKHEEEIENTRTYLQETEQRLTQQKHDDEQEKVALMTRLEEQQRIVEELQNRISSYQAPRNRRCLLQ